MRADLRSSATALIIGFLAAALAGCTNTYTGRWIVWNWSGIDDSAISRAAWWSVRRSASTSRRQALPYGWLSMSRCLGVKALDLAELGRRTATTALLVIRADTLLFEGYFNGYDRSSINTSFSVAKAITSLLVGMAIDDGFIGSVQDPVTRYVPELAARDARFTRLTLEHLLDMRSGLRWRDHDFVTGDKPRAYYHPNLRRLLLEEVGFTREPGEQWVYNSSNPILLGIVLERSTGRTVADYLGERCGPAGLEVYRPRQVCYRREALRRE